MLVWIAEFLTKYNSDFHVISYITVRAILALLTALLLSLWIGPKVIRRLQLLKFGQVVRNDGPESHFAKKGTPTMGGVMILFAIGVSTLLWADLTNPYVWFSLFVLFGYGAVGFVDDYRKITRKSTDGLIARWKYFWLSVIALVVIFGMRSVKTPMQPAWLCHSLRNLCRNWAFFILYWLTLLLSVPVMP